MTRPILPLISALRWVPPVAQGLVRDLRVRWALEEAGRPYEERMLALGEGHDDPDYRRLQPFGQVPSFEDGEVSMFESGAIVLQIAENAEALMPAESAARATTHSWMFAALNTLEPPVAFLDLLDRVGDPATARFRQMVVSAVELRLQQLAKSLGDREYIQDRFTAADLLMASVLRIPRGTGLIEAVPTLQAYVSRCEKRPAFARALAAQTRHYEENAPPQSSAA